MIKYLYIYNISTVDRFIKLYFDIQGWSACWWHHDDSPGRISVATYLHNIYIYYIIGDINVISLYRYIYIHYIYIYTLYIYTLYVYIYIYLSIPSFKYKIQNHHALPFRMHARSVTLQLRLCQLIWWSPAKKT